MREQRQTELEQLRLQVSETPLKLPQASHRFRPKCVNTTLCDIKLGLHCTYPCVNRKPVFHQGMPSMLIHISSCS